MDRRQQKTRKAIFKAFYALIDKKRYANITVQDIIDEANIGRSTFYAHFATKDKLLSTMCDDLFDHVFSDHLTSEETHDFSDDNDSLETKIIHILHHLYDNKKNILRILSCESEELFLQSFKAHLVTLFAQYLSDIKSTVPIDFILNYFVGSFAQTVQWWADNQMKHKPEKMARYYIEISNLQSLLAGENSS